MGATVAVVGLRQGVDCKPVIGQTDEHLVARVRVGEDAAFEAIYDRYAGGVLAFCVHMLRSREAAEDALQLTFVSAYRALRAADSSMSLRPWLYTIARNRCLSELRARRDGVDVDGVTVERPCFDGVADQVQRREELSEMLEDMQRLPSDQRAALVLFELGDHSHKEIAAVLGVRREKVKALIFQAREALVRSRHARDRPCVEIRERLATLHGRVLPRSTTRAHIDRCPSCAAFEDKVRRQRAALALIVPVTLTSELKAAVLGSALGGGGAVAAGAGACGSGAVVPAGTGAAGAVSAAGGATGAGGAGAGAVATGAGTAGLAGAGTGAASTAVVAGAPVSAVATGLTAVGAEYAASVGVGGLGATGVVAKLLTAAAIATWAAGASHPVSAPPRPIPVLATVLQIPITSASPAIAPTGAPAPGASTTPAATPSSANTTTSTTPAATPSSANTTTSTMPAATPSSANTATSTTSDATPSPGNTTTTAPSDLGTPAPPSDAPASTAASSDSSTPAPPTDAPASTPASSDPSTPAPPTDAPAPTPASGDPSTAAPPSDAPASTPASSDSSTPTPPTDAQAPTPASSDPSTAAPPTDAPAPTDSVPDPTGAPTTVDAIAPAAATAG
jgi:RNA polymerase sigma factor (sigma-70 family)